MYLHVFIAICLFKFVNEFWISLSYVVPQCVTKMPLPNGLKSFKGYLHNNKYCSLFYFCSGAIISSFLFNYFFYFSLSYFVPQCVLVSQMSFLSAYWLWKASLRIIPMPNQSKYELLSTLNLTLLQSHVLACFFLAICFFFLFVNEFWISLSYFVLQCVIQMSFASAYWLKKLQRVSSP